MDTPNPDALSAIRRKLSAPAGPFDMPGITVAKVMRLAVVRAIEEKTGLEVAVAGFVEEKTTLAGLAGGIVESDLVFATDGPQNSIGLVILDAAAVSGFIEQLITGRVVPGDTNTRRPTRTDATVVAGILSAISKQFEDGLDQVKNPPPISGFRTANLLEDARAVTLALEDVTYRCIHLSLDMDNGAKNGSIRLIFPWERAVSTAPGAGGDNSWGKPWKAAVERTQVSVEAILLRLSLSLAEVSALKVGDDVLVELAAVGNVSIIGRDGRTVGRGRLGQSHGFRAVRLETEAAAPMPPPPQMQPAMDTGPAREPIPPVHSQTIDGALSEPADR